MRDASTVGTLSEETTTQPIRIGELLPHLLAQYGIDRRLPCAEDFSAAYAPMGSYLVAHGVDLVHS